MSSKLLWLVVIVVAGAMINRYVIKTVWPVRTPAA